MRSKSESPFEAAVRQAKTSRLINVGFYAAVIALVACAVILSLFSDYYLFAILSGAAIILLSVGGLLKSLSEQRAVTGIAHGSVYACMLNRTQQQRILKHQMRRGQMFYFTAMLIIVIPEAIVLFALYFITKSAMFLIFMGIFAAAGLILVVLCILYMTARFSVRDPIVFVSPKGIIVGNEVLPFPAKERAVRALFRFSDYYNVQFVKSAVLGIKYTSELIFPVDGAVRTGLSGSVDEILIEAFRLEGVFVTTDAFYESRDYLAESTTTTVEPAEPGEAAAE